MSLRISFVAWLALTGQLAFPASAAAQDPAIGQAIAEKQCARCHAIGREGESRLPIAPPFRELARRYDPDNLAEAFAEGIVVGHPMMPEFVLEPEEVGGLIAYFHTLAQKPD